jgi:hypothetical protein
MGFWLMFTKVRHFSILHVFQHADFENSGEKHKKCEIWLLEQWVEILSHTLVCTHSGCAVWMNAVLETAFPRTAFCARDVIAWG